MKIHHRAFLSAMAFCACLPSLNQACTYALEPEEFSRKRPANPPHDEQTDFYMPDVLHRIHLELSKDEWEGLTPVEPVNAKLAAALPTSIEKERVIHRNRFPWSVGNMQIDGNALSGVGVRYKGNASFNLMKGSLKRNLKVKVDWTEEKQRYLGAKTFNFNAGGLDPSKLRDALGYAVFRKAGLPAPRTTFAEVTLTVPGIYDQIHLGLFTLVEQVNKSFLKSRFGNSKGLLMKPEGVLSMEFRGEDWADYASLYRPDDPPTPEQITRVIQFARLVNQGTDEEFKASIDSYLDIEGFLRFIAVNALIVNLDTLLVMPQNYYLYLDAATSKFVFFPWDLDISFAGWPLGGTADKQMQLSIRHPHSGNGHKLIDRLLSIPRYKVRYDQLINELVLGVFSKTQLFKHINTLENAVIEAITRDTASTQARNERGYPAPRGYQPPSLSAFVNKRHASIQRQLSGKDTGYIYAKPQMPFGRSQLALHVLVQGDTNQDRRLSKQELVTLFDQWFESMKKEGKATLTKVEFKQGLPDALFPTNFPHARPSRSSIPETYVTEGLFAAITLNRTGVVTKTTMTSFIGEWYEQVDTDGDDRLDRRQLTDALRKLIPH